MVVIKDFQMPKNCFECLLYEEDLKFCIIGSQGRVNRYGYDPNEKPLWCPLIEAPKSTKMIGMGFVGIEEDYPVSVKQVLNITAETGALTAQNRIRELLPVQLGRKKGVWIPQNYNKTNGMVSTAVYYYPKCSVCGQYANYTNFCPNCGADMMSERRR